MSEYLYRPIRLAIECNKNGVFAQIYAINQNKDKFVLVFFSFFLSILGM